MAKRYGRNQKRQHRQRIAELERQLRRGAGEPRREDPDLERFVIVRDVRDEFISGEYVLDERNVEVYCLVIDGDGLQQIVYDCGCVAFKGARYALERLEMPSYVQRREYGDFIRLQLKGVA